MNKILKFCLLKFKLTQIALLALFPAFMFASEQPQCLKWAGQEKCGYGCIQVVGKIYCGEKPGMTCIQFAGKAKCGFGCIEAIGKIECGTNEGDNCVQSAGQIKCGQACRVEVGQIKCGINTNSHGR